MNGLRSWLLGGTGFAPVDSMDTTFWRAIPIGASAPGGPPAVKPPGELNEKHPPSRTERLSRSGAAGPEKNNLNDGTHRSARRSTSFGHTPGRSIENSSTQNSRESAPPAATSRHRKVVSGCADGLPPRDVSCLSKWLFASSL